MNYAEKLIASYLILDEKVEWWGTSQDKPSNGLLPFVFSLLLFLIIVIVFRATSWTIPLVLPILASPLLLIIAELYNRLKAASNYYVITNQRIFIITDFTQRKLEVILPYAINEVKVEQVKNNSGNLYYAYEFYLDEGQLRYKHLGFEQVGNIIQASEALEKLYIIGLASRAEKQQILTKQINEAQPTIAYVWPFLLDAVKPHLLANEELIWVDKYYKVDTSTGKNKLVYSSLCLLIALCFYAKQWLLVAVPACAFTYLYGSSKSKKQNTIYFITNKRAIILVNDHIQYEFYPQHISRLKCEVVNQEIGSVYFQREPVITAEDSSSNFTDIGFANIRDMCYVALLLERLKNQNA